MAGDTYSKTAIVLRKTKVGETDLIIRMIAEDGTLAEGVAKGARKPSSSFSGRLELFNKVQVFAASGRGLDIIKESRLIDSAGDLISNPAANAAASCIAEFASKVIQPELENETLFAMTEAALSALRRSSDERLPLLVGAYMIKASSLLGFRPSFDMCSYCGASINEGNSEGTTLFSFTEGGVVCRDCMLSADAVQMPAELAAWLKAALMMRFADLLEAEDADKASYDVLDAASKWSEAQLGIRLRSLPLLDAFCR